MESLTQTQKLTHAVRIARDYIKSPIAPSHTDVGLPTSVSNQVQMGHFKIGFPFAGHSSKKRKKHFSWVVTKIEYKHESYISMLDTSKGNCFFNVLAQKLRLINIPNYSSSFLNYTQFPQQPNKEKAKFQSFS